MLKYRKLFLMVTYDVNRKVYAFKIWNGFVSKVPALQAQEPESSPEPM